jgi:iron complex transport system substrate-binding protein
MSGDLRIVSFLPAATEMVCALGLGDRLVGISHECDYPPEVRAKPVVVRPALDLEKMSLHEIDVAVSARLRTGASLYQIDEQRLRELAPTLILTQNLCQVCAPSGNEVSQVLKTMSPPPEILWLTPRSLEGVNENLRELGRATGRAEAAEALIVSGHERLEKISALTRRATTRPRVFCLEWVDPLYCSGHWISEMVELAGGEDALSRRGTDSVRIAWADVVRWAPQVLVVMPCGFSLRKAVEQVKQLGAHPGWSDLPAVRNGRVFAVNANAYFARPGPRLVDGTELLAHLFHPDLAGWSGPDDAFEQIRGRVGCPQPTIDFRPVGATGPTQMSSDHIQHSCTKRCSRCGTEFLCGPVNGRENCWCDDLPPVGPVAGGDHDCMCPSCLRAAIAKLTPG